MLRGDIITLKDRLKSGKGEINFNVLREVVKKFVPQKEIDVVENGQIKTKVYPDFADIGLDKMKEIAIKNIHKW